MTPPRGEGGWKLVGRIGQWALVFGRTFAGDEGDELADTFLHAFLGLFGDFGVLGQGSLHDTSNWSEVAYISI